VKNLVPEKTFVPQLDDQLLIRLTRLTKYTHQQTGQLSQLPSGTTFKSGSSDWVVSL